MIPGEYAPPGWLPPTASLAMTCHLSESADSFQGCLTSFQRDLGPLGGGLAEIAAEFGEPVGFRAGAEHGHAHGGHRDRPAKENGHGGAPHPGLVLFQIQGIAALADLR